MGVRVRILNASPLVHGLVEPERRRGLKAEHLSGSHLADLTALLPNFNFLVAAPGEISLGYDRDSIESLAARLTDFEAMCYKICLELRTPGTFETITNDGRTQGPAPSDQRSPGQASRIGDQHCGAPGDASVKTCGSGSAGKGFAAGGKASRQTRALVEPAARRVAKEISGRHQRRRRLPQYALDNLGGGIAREGLRVPEE